MFANNTTVTLINNVDAFPTELRKYVGRQAVVDMHSPADNTYLLKMFDGLKWWVNASVIKPNLVLRVGGFYRARNGYRIRILALDSANKAGNVVYMFDNPGIANNGKLRHVFDGGNFKRDNTANEFDIIGNW